MREGIMHEGYQPVGGQEKLFAAIRAAEGHGKDFSPQRRIIPIGYTALGDMEQQDDPAEVERLHSMELDQYAEQARLAVDVYAATPEFQKAARRRCHPRDAAVFIIRPDEHDEDSEALRKMAWLVDTAVFSKKDGNTMEDMRAHEDPERDYHVLSVKYTTTGVAPTGSMYLKVQSEHSLPSLEALRTDWGMSVRDVLLRHGGLPDLQFHPNVMDTMTVGILPEYQATTASLALYNATCRLSEELGIEYFVAVLDKYAADHLAKFENTFEEYLPTNIIPPQNYQARRKNANTSRPLFCHIPSWKRRLQEKNPLGYRIMWGDGLAKRFHFHNLWRDRLPMDTASDGQLTPDRLFKQPLAEGPMLYIDRSTITKQYQALHEAVPQADIHYAMKCNPDPPILEHIHNLGGSFEIASFAELKALLAIGINPADVLFSNPVKSEENIRTAYAAGVRCFAFQSMDELEKLKDLAPGANVYLRLKALPHASRVESEGKFGVAASSFDDQTNIAFMMKWAAQNGLKPYGLAFHVGSQMEDAGPWRNALQQAGSLMQMLENYGIQLQMLDLGGGFPAYHKAGLPDFKQFGTVIAQALQTLPYQPKKLALEPGRSLVANAGALVATVIGQTFRDGKPWVYLDVGAFNGFMEALETRATLMYPTADSRNAKQLLPYVVTGPSCDSQDIISNRLLLSAGLKVGDRVAFGTAGAYTTSYASRFNGFDIPTIVYTPLHDKAQKQ